MKSTEEKAKRMEMVDMHKFFLDKIDNAIKEKRYIEASWLIYSCMENRFFRTLQKYKSLCECCKGKSKCKEKTNKLAITTKIKCVKRLAENGNPSISDNFPLDLLKGILDWVYKRNDMMHDLLALDTYKNTDDDFKKSAFEGVDLLKQLYDSCTGFRKAFYTNGYEFIFPEKAMRDCPCGPRNKRDNLRS